MVIHPSGQISRVEGGREVGVVELLQNGKSEEKVRVGMEDGGTVQSWFIYA